MNFSFEVLVFLIIVALLFDFMNGFHDAANSIATVVSTGVLKPHQAVLMAAAFNFIALFVFQLKVATTVGKGIIDANIIDHYVVFWRTVGRYRVEHHYLVLRHTVQFVACAHRRPGRCRHRQGRGECADFQRAHQGGGVYPDFTAGGVSVVVVTAGHSLASGAAVYALSGGSMVAAAAVGVSVHVFPWAWRKRRAKNRRYYLDAADCLRTARR